MRRFLAVLTVAVFAGLAASAQEDPAGWYPFQPKDSAEPGEIGMQEWLEKPAGVHGRILRRDDELIYNGKPIKLWGINNTYGDCAPGKEIADKRASVYPKFGINSVRLHKYADGTGWAGIQSEDSFVEFDAAALDRMDYFVAQMKKNGVYVKLSSTFGVKLGSGDKAHVPYMDEFGAMRGNRVRTGHGSVYLSKELQDVQILQVVKLLKHTNPYTGMTYADDPAICVVELFNEDSALWFGTMGVLQRVPTLRQRTAERFCDMLRKKYGDHAGLVKAWGEDALDAFRDQGFVGEHLDKDNIVPAGNPWWYAPEQMNGSQAFQRQRLFDTMEFLYTIQNEFYDRYVAALRDAGYAGEILGSNWQAGRAYSHYLNLHSDYRVGLIDRHNYFGGSDRTATMLRVPGSGSLSSGMQQVVDRPFMLSEWIHVFPNEWGVEGPAIIGAYAMGLQGWDVSYMFQNRDDGGFSDVLGGHNWDVTAPQVFGVFPAVARQVLRGDVAESDLVVKRFVHVPSLLEGRLGFDDKVTQEHDVKTFDSDAAPVQTLAVARSVVEFTEEFRETPKFDLSPYVDDGTYASSTGQLRWTAGEDKTDGHFTMDTPGTKAVVGFARGEKCELGEVTIQPESDFGAIYVTAQDPAGAVATSGKLVVVAIARARNTGMVFDDEARRGIASKGRAPILMEPVKATIRIERDGNPTVELLDHDGLPTGKTIPVQDGTFTIDGARDATPYYVVRY